MKITKALDLQQEPKTKAKHNNSKRQEKSTQKQNSTTKTRTRGKATWKQLQPRWQDLRGPLPIEKAKLLRAGGGSLQLVNIDDALNDVLVLKVAHLYRRPPNARQTPNFTNALLFLPSIL